MIVNATTVGNQVIYLGTALTRRSIDNRNVDLRSATSKLSKYLYVPSVSVIAGLHTCQLVACLAIGLGATSSNYHRHTFYES